MHIRAASVCCSVTLRSISVSKIGTTKSFLLGILLVVVCIAAFTPSAYAAAPGPTKGAHQTAGTSKEYVSTKQDPTWLAKKRAYMIVSGARRNEPKGTKTNPHTLTQPYSIATAPAAYTLSTQYTSPVFEPGDGDASNYGWGTSHNDDSGYGYGFSNPYGICSQGYCDMVCLCGPGATDVTLEYWPFPNNNMTDVTAADWAPNAVGLLEVTTVWDAVDPYDKVFRMRGYMAYLAWQTQVPNQPVGMEDQTAYPTFGSTLYKIQRTLNWEASGYASNWASYFYVNVWWNQSSSSTFNSDVVADVSGSNVPVVAEVDASYLPNWSGAGRGIHHFISVIGYDNNAHTYTYLDTCGKSTGCNTGTSGGTDGQAHTVSQSTMWQAITAVPVNTKDDAADGDGGWVW